MDSNITLVKYFVFKHDSTFSRLRDGVQVELDSERFVDGTPEHPNLLIRNSSRYDQGVYTCICENEVGSSESSNSIYVNILRKFN